MNRDKGTIFRELTLNGYSDSIAYLPDKAHAMAQERKYVLPRKIDQLPTLKNYIFTKFQEKWSPDVIAAKSKEDVSLIISSESIYQYCYDEKNKSLGWYLLLASKHKKRLQATEVGKNCFNTLAKMHSDVRKTITFDNGLEFVNHTLLMDFLKMDTYFCDKHSPCKRDRLKKTNAMLNRFIPKSSSLSGLDEISLMQIQNNFNNIPRKILSYKTPAELFNQYLGGIALRT